VADLHSQRSFPVANGQRLLSCLSLRRVSKERVAGCNSSDESGIELGFIDAQLRLGGATRSSMGIGWVSSRLERGVAIERSRERVAIVDSSERERVRLAVSSRVLPRRVFVWWSEWAAGKQGRSVAPSFLPSNVATSLRAMMPWAPVRRGGIQRACKVCWVSAAGSPCSDRHRRDRNRDGRWHNGAAAADRAAMAYRVWWQDEAARHQQ
jgi:hypothetical protein